MFSTQADACAAVMRPLHAVLRLSGRQVPVTVTGTRLHTTSNCSATNASTSFCLKRTLSISGVTDGVRNDTRFFCSESC